MAFVARWLSLSRNREYEKGIRAFDQGLYDQAISHFTACLEETNEPATVRLARFYVGESYAQLGQMALMSGSLERSADCLESALSHHPNYPDLHYHLAIVRRKQGLMGEALNSVSKALGINGNFAKAILLQGILWYEAGRVVDGLKRIESVSANLDAKCIRLAIEQHEQGNSETTISILEQLLLEDSEPGAQHKRQADEALKQGKFEDAALAYSLALEINPGYADLHCCNGLAYFELGQTEKAIESLGRAIQINPHYAEAQFLLAKTYAAAGNLAKAREILSELVSTHPEYPGAQQLLQEEAA